MCEADLDLSMSTDKTDAPNRKQTIAMLCQEFMRMDKRFLCLTVLNAAERSRRMSSDESLSDLAAWRFPVTAKGDVSVECTTLKAD